MTKNSIKGNTTVPVFDFIELFCGAGGMSLGLKKAGFNNLLSIDSDEHAIETYQKNLGGKCLTGNIVDVSSNELMEIVGINKGELHLVAGGPPCQGFSYMNVKAQYGDKRNDLVMEFTRIVRDLNPASFIFENVPAFNSIRGRKYIEAMHEQLSDYKFHPHLYNCHDYGIPQTRRRFVIVGLRDDCKVEFKIPEVFKCKKFVRDIVDLPEPPNDHTEHRDHSNHQLAMISKSSIARLSFVPQGGNWKDIPKEHRLEHQNKLEKKGWDFNSYGRLHMDRPCPTITKGFSDPAKSAYSHPLEDRPITCREAARIQGFPDDFIFHGPLYKQRQQIANAVPPPLAEVIGKEIKRCLEGNENKK